MRSLGCLYLVVVKSAVLAVAGPTTVGGIAVMLMSADLVRALPEAELEAVLAHEVAHSANGDGRVMGTAFGSGSGRPPSRPFPPAEPDISTGPFCIHHRPRSGANTSTC